MLKSCQRGQERVGHLVLYVRGHLVCYLGDILNCNTSLSTVKTCTYHISQLFTVFTTGKNKPWRMPHCTHPIEMDDLAADKGSKPPSNLC